MSVKTGRDLLLKLDHDNTGNFKSVAGLRSRRIAFNANAADITTTESAGRWRELLQGSGTRSVSLSGRGIFRDDDSSQQVQALFFASQQVPWRLIINGFGQIEAPFHISALEYAGEFNGEMNYELALESAGQVIFSALG
ncbi:phage major tail protein, TP901-1 family [Polycladidibacter stylochi]|uniref:phage major tail protein, TP901-1 family n=1 Tax=Polycladidibacter stylochi TaxID=1807766 RepID=UPI000835863D|nr:phage major tail protein, TP901-1 family [Pseudovibrio stylochi]